MKKIVAENRKRVALALAAECVVLLFFALGRQLSGRELYFREAGAEALSVTRGIYSEDRGGVWADDTFNYEESGNFTYGPYLPLPAGIYDVTLFYETDTGGNTCNAFAADIPYGALKADVIFLPEGVESVTFRVWLSADIDNFELQTTYCGVGTFIVKGFSIAECPQAGLYRAFKLFCAFLLLDGAALLWLLWKKGGLTKEEQRRLLILGAIILASSVPLGADYVMQGHDIRFHLMRIEGLREGLVSGQFPVRIQPYWLDGYGYAASVFYGDLLLYFPALLRIAGFTAQGAYNAFLLFVNAATCVLAYKGFKKIFRSENAALLGSALYTLSAYRLTDLYVRSAVGEFCAMIFLPTLLAGVYGVLFDDVKRPAYQKAWIAPALAAAGIGYSHVISCFTAGTFLFLGLLLCYKRVFRAERFFALCKTALAAILLCASYAAPFIDYGRDAFTFNAASRMDNLIQTDGVYPAQLFSLFQNGSGNSQSGVGGITGEMPLCLGAALMLGAAAFLYACVTERETIPAPDRKKGFALLLLSGIACFLCTIYFPWDRISRLGDFAALVVSNVQFPWRYLGVAGLMLAGVSCSAVLVFRRAYGRAPAAVLSGALAAAVLLTSSWTYFDVLNEHGAYRYYDKGSIGTFSIGGGEYLPEGTDADLLHAGEPVAGRGVAISEYEKNGVRVTFFCENESGKNANVAVPLLYYRYYTAKTDSGESLTCYAGGNNALTVTVPPDFAGAVTVDFREPVSWRAAEAVSAAALLFVLGFGMEKKRRAGSA
ncbi:MAG TPA: hypothetical protein PKI76_06295 [Oscillospiraceae bacterium]|nr:hypothetical protein [Oscillospiraceae bacterium]HNW04976.1 hypothetical protein [Oscillospiraceae bacterium]